MTKRMLIDASHQDETRVVVFNDNRLEEYDYESASRKQLKGNIYLAKVTRVEPSLQAAFVEYGGNRQGFLSFSEIHPDYYRIPVADRRALIEQESQFEDDGPDENHEDGPKPADDTESSAPPDSATDTSSNGADTSTEDGANNEPDDQNGEASHDGKLEEIEVETKVDTVGGDEVEDASRRRAQRLRRYKIQEVIKRRQVMLVQVSKEERGTKGAALTTYLSLAGRYCVLMPNTAKGGGISRKIANPSDRRRLKKVISEMEIPEGMAVIVRTAGSQRSKVEIRRDYEYLVRLWNEIRETTLASTAPCPDLRGSQSDQAHPSRPLQPRHGGGPGRRRGRVQGGQGFRQEHDPEPRAQGEAVQGRRPAADPQVSRRKPARRHAQLDGSAQVRRLRS